jgi:hypothetical protein
MALLVFMIHDTNGRLTWNTFPTPVTTPSLKASKGERIAATTIGGYLHRLLAKKRFVKDQSQIDYAR